MRADAACEPISISSVRIYEWMSDSVLTNGFFMIMIYLIKLLWITLTELLYVEIEFVCHKVFLKIGAMFYARYITKHIA